MITAIIPRSLGCLCSNVIRIFDDVMKKTLIEQWSSFPGAGNEKLSLPEVELIQFFNSISFRRCCILVDIGLAVSLLYSLITSVFGEDFL